MLAPIAAILLLLAPLAHAEDASSLVLCLSDGQVLTADRVEERTAHRTVHIGRHHFRLDPALVGRTCDEARPPAATIATRRVTLRDGQVLLGTPTVAAGGLALILLDGKRIHLPQGLVKRVEDVPREDPPEVRKAQAFPAAAPPFTLPKGTGLGILVTAILGGMLFGLLRMRAS